MFKIGDRVQSKNRELRNRQGNGTVVQFSPDKSEFLVEYDTKISQRTYFSMWHKTNTQELKIIG